MEISDIIRLDDYLVSSSFDGSLKVYKMVFI